MEKCDICAKMKHNYKFDEELGQLKEVDIEREPSTLYVCPECYNKMAQTCNKDNK